MTNVLRLYRLWEINIKLINIKCASDMFVDLLMYHLQFITGAGVMCNEEQRAIVQAKGITHNQTYNSLSRDKTRLNTVCQGSNKWQQNRIVLEEKKKRNAASQSGIWAREGPSRANYPAPFYYDFNWRTTSFGWKLAGFGTMHDETGTQCLDECNWLFRNRDAFMTIQVVGAHLLPHYRLRCENMLSTAIAKLSDGVTVYWGSFIVETFNGPSSQWPLCILHNKRG